MADPLTLDPEILALCDDAAMIADFAAKMGVDFITALRVRVFQLRANAQRLVTGYMPKAQRKAVAHGLYSMGIRKAPARSTAADRARSEAQAWGLA
jgi:hypothetical protein